MEDVLAWPPALRGATWEWVPESRRLGFRVPEGVVWCGEVMLCGWVGEGGEERRRDEGSEGWSREWVCEWVVEWVGGRGGEGRVEEERRGGRDWTEVRQPSHRGHQSGDSSTKVGLDSPVAQRKRLST